MKRKSPRKSASKWDQSAERALLELWTEKMPRFRSCRKNSHILKEIASELEPQGFSYTIVELKTKIHNMTQRYRKEKIKMESSGSPSDWEFYNDMDSLLGPYEGLPPGSLLMESINKHNSQLRYKSLSDRIAKFNSENYSVSSSGTEIEQNQRQYHRLREHMKPQKRIIRSSSSQQSQPETKLDDKSKDAQSSELSEVNEFQSVISLPNTSVLDTDPIFFTEHIPSAASSRKRPRYQADDETITEFLNKITKILETRYSVPSASKKEIGHNEGFFAMVQEIFNDLPTDVVRNAKFFFINYLRDQMEAIKKK